MKRVGVKIHGAVQGVGFRSFVRQNAQKLGVSGWVKNNLDGTVEALFEGEDDSVSKMIEFCKKGPFPAWIEKVELREEEPKNEFIDFMIVK